jgi:phosphate transport system substrate-binding protein
MAFLGCIEGIRKIILEEVKMRKIKSLRRIYTAILLAISFYGCNEVDTNKPITDSPSKGTINISVDESFEPVMREQIEMYEAAFPGTKINAQYKSEADCIKDFFRDSSTRLVIVTRGLTEQEDKLMLNNLGYRPGWQPIASDAIAVVLNKESKDTIYSLGKLQQMLQGEINRDKAVVFDGLNKTSTIRFIEDSVLRGTKFDTTVVKAVKGSQEVLNYVSTHTNAVGFVGINQIGNPENAKQVAMLQKVKFAYVQCIVCQDTPYILPSQESIQNRRYPLVRNIHYILKENYKGLGSGFASFLQYERGQLIFRRAYLGPVMNFTVRNVNLKEKIDNNRELLLLIL